MGEEVPIANPPLSAKEQAVVAKLTDTQLQNIDTVILANCAKHWLKVSRVTSDAEKALCSGYPELSHAFYALRLARLVEEKCLESRGNLDYIRFSEVRIPPKD